MINSETYTDDAIQFWHWFKDISGRLSIDLRQIQILSELDRRTLELGFSNWEIGPYSEDKFFLAISPGLDSEALIRTKYFVSLAIDVDNWIFFLQNLKKVGFQNIKLKMKQD